MSAVPASVQGPALRDIHLPPPPSWWPPAPGWWLLAALLVVLAWFASRWLWSRIRERRWRRRVLAELERIAESHQAQPDPAHLVMQVSQLLRRASLLIEPEAAALRGEEWLHFLDARLPAGGAASFRGGEGRALIELPYRRAGDPALQALNAHALLDLARAWLAHALPRGRGRV